MNQLYCDQKQRVFIKICENQTKLKREMVGANVFSKFSSTPDFQQIDTRTLILTKLTGVTADKIPEEDLNKLIVCFFAKVRNNFKGPVYRDLLIETLIDDYFGIFADFPYIIGFLDQLRKRVTGFVKFPIHGDLQKQNILVKPNGQLVLIDFEHFCFAPQELELVNSLFHRDKNCLDLSRILPPLLGNGLISIDLLTDFLIFYGLKEISQGLSFVKTREKVFGGLKLLSRLTGKKVRIDLIKCLFFGCKASVYPFYGSRYL